MGYKLTDRYPKGVCKNILVDAPSPAPCYTLGSSFISSLSISPTSILYLCFLSSEVDLMTSTQKKMLRYVTLHYVTWPKITFLSSACPLYKILCNFFTLELLAMLLLGWSPNVSMPDQKRSKKASTSVCCTLRWRSRKLCRRKFWRVWIINSQKSLLVVWRSYEWP